MTLRLFALSLCVAVTVLPSLADAAGRRSRRLTPYDFFKPPALQAVQLNPRGDLYISVVTTFMFSTIRVQTVRGQRSADVVRYLAADAPEVFVLQWIGDRTVIASLGDSAAHHVIHVEISESDLDLEFNPIIYPGLLVDGLPESEHEILLSPYTDPRSVYRVSVDQLTTRLAGDRTPFEPADRVTKMKEPPQMWRVDATGDPRLAMTRDGQGVAKFWIRESGTTRWRHLEECWRQGDEWIVPLAFHSDGRSLVVASATPNRRTALYTCTPGGSGELVPFIEDDERDILGMVPSADGRSVLGGYFFKSGYPVFRFVSGDVQNSWQHAEYRFPGKAVWPVSGGESRGPRVVWVGSTSDAGRYVLLSGEGHETDLGRVAPWFDRQPLGATRFFSLEVPDVGRIEAYLTLPTSGEPEPPLIVYPHGGPVGVMDAPVFDHGVQFLASSGYAVLRVNYRGSGGFGRDFEEAGFRQWGRGIEDDIDRAIEHVLEKRLASKDRICIIGESYGGYSAVMSVVRHPRTFACAATTAGVSDLGLLFDPSSLSQSTESLRKGMVELVGNPERDYEELKRYSPVYRVSEIETPLLIIHGEADEIVDVEHARRLQLMLQLHDKPHDTHILPDVGHGGWPRRTERWYFETLKEFLDYYLE